MVQLQGPVLLKMIEVGLFWRKIKGRFSAGQSRTYLAMKYGYRWLSKVKMARVRRAQGGRPAVYRLPPVEESLR